MMDENQDSLSDLDIAEELSEASVANTTGKRSVRRRLESLDTIFEEPEKFFCENDTD